VVPKECEGRNFDRITKCEVISVSKDPKMKEDHDKWIIPLLILDQPISDKDYAKQN
jgi:hypothetical protein